MKADKQTSKHLLLAVVITVFSVILILTVIVMGWEPWVVPLMATGCVGVWSLHIGRGDQARMYENLCAGLLLLEFFFFSVHESSLFDIPAVACIVTLALFMLNKKWVLHVVKALYVLALLYHVLILRTITYDIGFRDGFRLVLGAGVTLGGAVLADYWIGRRTAQQAWYTSVFAELETAGKQNAVFLSNVSHELRTPINMVLGISEVALGKELAPDVRSDLTSIKLAGKRLSNQINNMLDYTEIVEGTLLPAKEHYMITSVLNDVITNTALQTNRHRLELVFDIDPKIPAVLVGDADQLPSVGAGNVFADLIRSDRVETVFLREVFRQAEQSAIIRAAHAVNLGKPPERSSPTASPPERGHSQKGKPAE